MDEVEVRAPEKFLLGVTEYLLDGRIDTFEVSVEARDRDEVRREREDAVGLVLRPGATCRVDAKCCGESSQDDAGGEDDPRQHRRGALDGSLRHDDGESLSPFSKGGAHPGRPPM